MWDDTVNVREIREIRTATIAYLGAGALEKVEDIAKALKEEGVDCALCVTGARAYRTTGAWDALQDAARKNDITLVLYDRVTPNPTTRSIDEATGLGREAGAKAVIAIGGGSPIDTAKSAAVLLTMPGRTAEELYMGAITAVTALPIVAINLTHGTGSEVDRFAVATIAELNYKPALAANCMYPRFAIDDPALMTGLSPDQTRYVSIDAVNHAIEAATAKTANPLSILLATETIRLVAKYLPSALRDPGDLKARYCLAYASLIAGVAFDNGLLHFTHALEHPLSALKPDLPHGLGLAMILPAVVEACYASKPEVFAEILKPIVPDPGRTSDAAERAGRGVENWLASVGVPQKLPDGGFEERNIAHLCQLVENTPSLRGLLSVAPIQATENVVANIYLSSLKAKR